MKQSKLNRFVPLSDASPYRTSIFNANNQEIFPVRAAGERPHLTPQEYVAIICDILRMKKSVCLCRHFHRLDKTAITKAYHEQFIDVWPVNVFNPSNDDPFTVVSLFMLQLACIINMLSKWKKLHLRVFLCESNDNHGQR